MGPHSEHRFPAPASLKEVCRKPLFGVWLLLPAVNYSSRLSPPPFPSGINSIANNQNNGTTSNNEPYDIIYNQNKEDNLYTKKNDLLPVASLTQRRALAGLA